MSKTKRKKHMLQMSKARWEKRAKVVTTDFRTEDDLSSQNSDCDDTYLPSKLDDLQFTIEQMFNGRKRSKRSRKNLMCPQNSGPTSKRQLCDKMVGANCCLFWFDFILATNHFIYSPPVLFVQVSQQIFDTAKQVWCSEYTDESHTSGKSQPTTSLTANTVRVWISLDGDIQHPPLRIKRR